MTEQKRSFWDRLFGTNNRSGRQDKVLEGADVAMSGGSSECGGSVVIYLKAGEEERI